MKTIIIDPTNPEEIKKGIEQINDLYKKKKEINIKEKKEQKEIKQIS